MILQILNRLIDDALFITKEYCIDYAKIVPDKMKEIFKSEMISLKSSVFSIDEIELIVYSILE